MSDRAWAFLTGAVIVWLFLHQQSRRTVGYRGFRLPASAGGCGCGPAQSEAASGGELT